MHKRNATTVKTIQKGKHGGLQKRNVERELVVAH